MVKSARDEKLRYSQATDFFFNYCLQDKLFTVAAFQGRARKPPEWSDTALMSLTRWTRVYKTCMLSGPSLIKIAQHRYCRPTRFTRPPSADPALQNYPRVTPTALLSSQSNSSTRYTSVPPPSAPSSHFTTHQIYKLLFSVCMCLSVSICLLAPP